MKVTFTAILAGLQALTAVLTTVFLLQIGDEAEQQFSVTIRGHRYDCAFTAKKAA